VPLAAICESPGHAWNDVDITELLNYTHTRKPLLAGDLNVKYSFCNSVVPNISGTKLLNISHINEFEISAPQGPTHYCPVGKCDVLDIVVHKNVRLSEVIISDIIDSDHLPTVFQLLDHVKSRSLSDPVDKFTDWERFQGLASELI
jgi:hypothetical protein